MPIGETRQLLVLLGVVLHVLLGVVLHVLHVLLVRGAGGRLVILLVRLLRRGAANRTEQSQAQNQRKCY